MNQKSASWSQNWCHCQCKQLLDIAVTWHKIHYPSNDFTLSMHFMLGCALYRNYQWPLPFKYMSPSLVLGKCCPRFLELTTNLNEGSMLKPSPVYFEMCEDVLSECIICHGDPSVLNFDESNVRMKSPLTLGPSSNMKLSKKLTLLYSLNSSFVSSTKMVSLLLLWTLCCQMSGGSLLQKFIKGYAMWILCRSPDQKSWSEVLIRTTATAMNTVQCSALSYAEVISTSTHLWACPFLK